MHMISANKEPKNLNLLNVVSLGLGSIIGAGIFALLGQVILLAGSKTYLAFIIGGCAAMFSGYSYAKLAGHYPISGGLTDYFHLAFKSKFTSGGLSLVYMIASAISIAMLAKSFGIYMSDFFHAGHNLTVINSFAGGLTIALALLNMQKASDVGWAETVIVILKIAILLIIIGAAYLQPSLQIANSPLTGKHIDFFCLCRIRSYHQCRRQCQQAKANHGIRHLHYVGFGYLNLFKFGICSFKLHSV